VRKPYESEELLRRIDNTLTRRRLEKENNHILQRLQQSEKWHRFLVNSSPISSTPWMRRPLHLRHDRVESLIGYRREELLGQHYSQVIHEDDIARAEHISTNAVPRPQCAQYRNPPQVQPGMRRPAPDERPLQIGRAHRHRMYDDEASPFEQRFIGSYGVAKDVTERKQPRKPSLPDLP